MPDLPSDKFPDLRRRAESQLTRIVAQTLPNLPPEDRTALVHELRVHQIELELQCQELQQAQAEAEEGRDRYRELYESIPLGYVTIDVSGRIFDLNPAGADLLRVDRKTTPKNFNVLFVDEDLSRFALFCRDVVAQQKALAGEFKMKLADGAVFVALLQAVPVRIGEGSRLQLRIAFKDITRRKQAEDALRHHEVELETARELAVSSLTGALHRESQAARELLISSLRLDGILQSAMDAIMTVDEQQHILMFNEAAERMFQVPAREAIGQMLDKFIPARFRKAHHQHVEGFGKSGVTSRRMGELGAVVGLRGDGKEFPVEASISHISVEGKKFYTVILRDITERKQAEEALRGSEERLRSTLDNMLEGCLIIGFDWRYLYLNEAACRHGRRPRAQLLGRTMMESYPGLEETTFFRTLKRCMQHRTSSAMESEFTFPDGSKALFELSIQPVPEGLLVLSYDVTDRKQAEKMIRQSEERYRRLITVSPYAILVSRMDRLIFANDRALKLFGAVKMNEILGKSPFELFHPDCHAMMRQRIEDMSEGRSLMRMVEEKILMLDGTAIDVEVSATQFTDEEGPAVLLMLRDVSDRKQLQEQLRRTERIAELGTVASGMAHEIGTPMNVILGRAEYLMERVQDEPIKKGLQTIVAQVERITKVMNQLLSFARRRTPERGAVDVKQIVETSVEIFQERFARNRIQVDLHLDVDCPQIHADADQMHQVLINLIMNAVHAMPEGGTLRIGIAPARDHVVLTLSDTGHGIPQEVRAHIFEPFFTTKEFGKGTGLGLTVVKGILEEHGGSISVASEAEQGTTFTILLPKVG